MLPVECSHYRPVIGDQFLRAVGFAEQFVPFLVGIFHRVALAFEPVVGPPAGHVPRIMMQPPAPHPSESAFSASRPKNRRDQLRSPEFGPEPMKARLRP